MLLINNYNNENNNGVLSQSTPTALAPKPPDLWASRLSPSVTGTPSGCWSELWWLLE